MANTAVHNFIDALREWDKVTGEFKSTDYKTLLTLINLQIGLKHNQLDFSFDATEDEIINLLENRIIYLIHEQDVDELFLVTSLINWMNIFFESTMEKTVDAIQLFSGMINDSENKNDIDGSIGDSFSHKKLTELLSHENKSNTKNEYFRWKSIVANKLSEEHIESWDRELTLEISKGSIEVGKKYIDEYGNMTIGEIARKLNKKNEDTK
ncbi:hypothetical protein KTC96_14265 [Clostridium estertheticum]|uniref:hypothetical protein n=1 Tax=Clostridium estertheticum TaxID=238834 RepID=UPI001C7DBBE1|nr:hypothetical protein [Clostridium estertheticum]MBX4258840.1 hypothetical protein [Clostridium estertheticum]WLC69154.1 hypothetical protein KTC96_14265 [Clostridium estertheticum]